MRWIIFLILVLILISGCNVEKECSKKQDCVKAECCHAKTCTTQENKPNCNEIVCTMECQPGTMDCGQGYCDCISGKCEAVIK